VFYRLINFEISYLFSILKCTPPKDQPRGSKDSYGLRSRVSSCILEIKGNYSGEVVPDRYANSESIKRGWYMTQGMCVLN